MTTLNELGIHHGTDKATVHGYTHFYDRLFKGMRSRPIKILEIGVAGGESIKMWADWFYNKDSRIYGVEIENRPLPEFDDRTQIFINNAALPNAVFDISNATGPLDILVDDGSHYCKDQRDALRLWWPHIKPGGIYICEDTFTSNAYPWWDTEEQKFVHSLNEYIDKVNGPWSGQGTPTDGEVEEIIFRKGIIVIRKSC